MDSLDTINECVSLKLTIIVSSVCDEGEATKVVAQGDLDILVSSVRILHVVESHIVVVHQTCDGTCANPRDVAGTRVLTILPDVEVAISVRNIDCTVFAIGTVRTIGSIGTILTNSLVGGLGTILYPIAVIADGPCSTRGTGLTILTVCQLIGLTVAQRQLHTIGSFLHFGDYATTLNQGLDLVNQLLVGVNLLLQVVDVVIVILTGSYGARCAYSKQTDEQVT